MTKTEKLISGFVGKLFAAAGIALSTGIAWVLYELLVHGDVDNLADAWVRSAGRTLGHLFAMDPVIASIAIPLATFAAIAMTALFFARARA